MEEARADDHPGNVDNVECVLDRERCHAGVSAAMPAARACRRWDPCYRRWHSEPGGFRRTGTCISCPRACSVPLALTDALPRAPQVCSTSREDKHTGFTVPPQTTRDLVGHPRERESLGERSSSTRGEGGGGWRSKKKGCIQSQRAGLTQVMMMISIVLF